MGVENDFGPGSPESSRSDVRWRREIHRARGQHLRVARVFEVDQLIAEAVALQGGSLRLPRSSPCRHSGGRRAVEPATEATAMVVLRRRAGITVGGGDEIFQLAQPATMVDFGNQHRQVIARPVEGGAIEFHSSFGHEAMDPVADGGPASVGRCRILGRCHSPVAAGSGRVLAFRRPRRRRGG